jgi:myo-inositol catabolism protein IolS
MDPHAFPRTGWLVNSLGMGCWGLGGQYGPVSEIEAVETVHRALALGVNLFDTADAYGLEPGSSETLLGRALVGRRDDVFVATKVGNWARRHGHPFAYTHPLHIIACCDASLYRLKTDRIDLYQCHIGVMDDASVFLDAFDALIAQGKIRAFGLSTHDVATAQRFDRDGRLAAVQLDYSLLNRTAEAELLPWCRERGIATLVRGPLAQGLLSGRFTRESTFTDSVREKWSSGPGREEYLRKIGVVEALAGLAPVGNLTALALHFLLGQAGVTCLIPGARTPAQIEQLAALSGKPFPVPRAGIDAVIAPSGAA